MLEGKIKIELNNIKTGEKQIIEKNNLVTNAVRDILNSYSKNKNGFIYGNSPIYKNFFGGIFLFNKKQIEDPDNYFARTGTKITGCGKIDFVNSTSKYFGSFNSAESSFDTKNKIYKFVYDFKEQEANGIINSICLTSKDAGISYPVETTEDLVKSFIYTGLYRDSNLFNREYNHVTSGQNYNIISLKNNCKIIFNKKDDYSNELTITKNFFPYKKMSIFSAINNVNFKTKELFIPNAKYPYCSYYDSNNKKLYLFSSDGKIRIINEALEIIKENTFPELNITARNCTMTIKNNLIYFFKLQPEQKGVLIKINPETLVIENQQDFIEKVPSYVILCDPIITEDYIYINFITNTSYGYNFTYIFDENSNLIQKIPYITKVGQRNNSATIIYQIDNSINGVGSCDYTEGGFTNPSNSLCFITNYLATINNLPEPITKTEEMTMKITYTLSEVNYDGPDHELKVVRGTGSGFFKQHEKPTIVAQEPEDPTLVFDKWNVTKGTKPEDLIETNSTCTFTMPNEDLTVEALFKQAA